ncbi:hypothetical protein [Foetidibacter luteolus]|uniref:hypothetical protein n=1 Tax=Foetidibacter luteolus TaxID=2608880 RepID=UPI00129B3738|nr:hypothetical protein [Foetidibacter luteolus]
MKKLFVSGFFCCCIQLVYAQALCDSCGGFYWFGKAGWQFSGHSGVDASINFVNRKEWFLSARAWVADYHSRQYPKRQGNTHITGKAFSHEEIALLIGRLYHLKENKWFLTAEAGPSFLRYSSPVGIDSFPDKKGALAYCYKRNIQACPGLAFSASINWRYHILAVGVSPQIFLNRLHSYAALTYSMFVYINQ